MYCRAHCPSAVKLLCRIVAWLSGCWIVISDLVTCHTCRSSCVIVVDVVKVVSAVIGWRWLTTWTRSVIQSTSAQCQTRSTVTATQRLSHSPLTLNWWSVTVCSTMSKVPGFTAMPSKCTKRYITNSRNMHIDVGSLLQLVLSQNFSCN